MLRGAARVRPWRALAIAVGVAAALLAIAHGSDQTARLLAELEVAAADVRAWLVAGVALVGAAVVLLSLVAQLFEPERLAELERLACLPLGSGAVFGCLLVDQLPAAALMLYLASPLLGLVARQAALDWGATVALGAGIFAIALQLICGLLAAAILLVRLLPAWLLRLRGALGAMMLAPLVFAVGLALVAGSWRQWPAALPQSVWFDELVAGLAGDARSLWRGSLSLAAATAACALIAESVCRRVLLPDLAVLVDKLRPGSSTSPASTRSARPGGGLDDVAWRQLAGLLRREWLAARRDRGMLLAWGMGGVVVAMPAMGLLVLPAEARGPYLVLYWGGVGWAGFNALALAGLVSFPREGVGLGLLGWLPVSEGRLLAARVLAHQLPAALWAGAFGGALAGLVDASAAVVWACALAFGGGLAASAVLCGAVFGRAEAGAFRGVSALGLAVFALLQLLLLLTVAGLALAMVHLGPLTAAIGWLAAALSWGAALTVLADEAHRTLRRRRRGLY